jgi:hypothetical protein
MGRVWAVARHMIAESVRQKIALLGILLVVLMLAVLPFVTEGDGLTLTSRVQSFLAYTLGGVGVVLSVVTVFLSCLTISEEISNKRIFMIASKPIPRWQFFFGKWLGIGLLNAGLLLVSFVAVLGATWGLSKVHTQVVGDEEQLKFEVLSARHSLTLTPPDFTPEIESRVRRMREEGRFDDVGAAAQVNIREQIAEELKTSWRSIPPGEARRFEFKGLMVDREGDHFVHLRMKPTHSGGMTNVLFPAVIQCGDPADTETLTADVRRDFLVERFHNVPIPTWAVNKDGTLYVTIGNLDPVITFTFEGNDTFELLYDLGTFHWNLFRTLSIIWCRLAFLAAVGLLLSSSLSFPVAAMACFLVLIVSSAAGFLGQAIGWVTPMDDPSAQDPLWIIGPVIRPLAQAFIWLVPDFSQFDPVDNVVNGRLVPLMWVIHSVVVLILVKGIIVGVLGCVILTRRELASETS